MNVSVRHNGSTITSRVVKYVREHRICTSIGTLDITLEGTYGATINPWDEIDIYENGSFQVKYYVSDISHSVPDGTITLQCQDKSKRLVDYFIPDSYTIDYPSTTRYWIEKFLAEAGISYSFLTSSQGNLLSNYTALGLQPAYDQIMLLLQLSGWYMYFDGNGTAVIGALDVDLASTAGSLGKTDILEIVKLSNDKMLRNRALVWGEYDPFRQEYAFADVTKMTSWNYDSNDVRTMVVSNQNIPNSTSAYNIANILVKEFAKITIEKHIVAWGARNFDLGDAIRVNSDVWNGKGLITTFGVSMDRSGLVTNIILDERCPRLYGFFNFGDYVYVGTFGDGVWRKHIKFDPTWYDFSSGLTNLHITDLHINQGIFGAVGHSGEMYYANSEDGPWNLIPSHAYLESSVEDIVTTSGFPTQAFSGIMARAVIVDRTTNNIKFGVDNWSGLNTGDYFLTYSGMFATSSGVIVASGVDSERGWILEYDPYTGTLVDTVYSGVTSSGVYPISYSGNYNIRVLDLENDGINDYVSVKTGSEVEIEHTEYGYNFGKHISQYSNYTQDGNTVVALGPLTEFDGVSGMSLNGSATSVLKPVVFDNESINERELVWRQSGTFKRLTITKSPLASSTLTSPTSSPALSNLVAIIKLSTDNYRAYGFSSTSNGDFVTSYTIKYQDWNAALNTVSAISDVVTLTIPDDSYHGNAFYEHVWTSPFLVVNGTLRAVVNHEVRSAEPAVGDPDWDLKANNYTEVYSISVDLASGSGSAGLVATFNFPTSVNSLGGARWTIQNIANNFYMYQNGNNVESYFLLSSTKTNDGYLRTNYLIYSRDSFSFVATEIENTTSSTDPDMLIAPDSSESAQLTGEHFFTLWKDSAQNNAVYLYNGDTLQITTLSSIPWNFQSANIYPLFGTFDDYFIARNGTDWYFCNPQTLSPEIQFVPPVNYNIIKPYSTTDSTSPRYYWQADNNLGADTLLQTTESTTISECQPTAALQGNQSGRAFICGNFFIDYKDPGNTTATMGWFYLDNAINVPKIQGTSFMVLQREGTQFNLIREEGKPLRIDISNNSPIITAMDFEDTFETDIVFGNQLTVITATGLLNTREVRDYRYTMLETTSSGTIVGSGVGVQSQILYVTESGVYHSDSATYSGGFVILDVIASGVAERIETTNFVYPGQFIFVTTSGDNPMFYQKDNDGLIFNTYSGLPDSRATIIRCDDRM